MPNKILVSTISLMVATGAAYGASTVRLSSDNVAHATDTTAGATGTVTRAGSQLNGALIARASTPGAAMRKSSVYEYLNKGTTGGVVNPPTSDLSGYELIANKTDNVTANAASGTKYASAKGVADYAEAVASKVTRITAASTDIEYPSAKAVWREISRLEDMIGDSGNIDLSSYELKSNKTDNVGANATSSVTYASTKGVADYVANKADKVGSGSKLDLAVVNKTTGQYERSGWTVQELIEDAGAIDLSSKEDKANKTDDVAGNATSTVRYPSTKGVADYAAKKQGAGAVEIANVDAAGQYVRSGKTLGEIAPPHPWDDYELKANKTNNIVTDAARTVKYTSAKGALFQLCGNPEIPDATAFCRIWNSVI